MYYPDLSAYEYGWPVGYEAAYGGLPVRNVGWLSSDHSFPTGDVPEEFPSRLRDLCAAQLWRNPGLHLFGVHNCEFCPPSHSHGSVEVPGHRVIGLGSDELRILDRDCVYAAPNLIYHYVTAHRYRPPDDFIAAVMKTPARENRARAMYVFHLSEAVLNPRLQREFSVRADTGHLPGSLAGTSLGPLVGRYRRAQGAILAGLGLILLTSRPVASLLGLFWPSVLVAGALLGFSLLLAGAYWAERLPCPFCGAALTRMKEPETSMRRPEWHDRLQFSSWIYCAKSHYAFAYRLSPFPWSAPPCHVWFQ